MTDATIANNLEPLLADWHRRKYGDRPVDIQRTLAKAMEELGELARGILRGDVANAKEEAADVAITLTHLVRGLGGSLAEEVAKKYRVIEERLAGKLLEREEAQRDEQ